MTNKEFLQLKTLCEDPGSFLDLVEDWEENRYSSDFLIHRLLSKYDLADKIEGYELKQEKMVIQGTEFEPLGIHFQLKSDHKWYTLFGIIAEDEKLHVSLAERTIPYLN